jgi:hypothetical protein
MSLQGEYRGRELQDSIVANWDEYDPSDKKIKLFRVYNTYGPRSLVFTETEEEALDIAADKGHIDEHKISPTDPDYDAQAATYHGNAVSYLGNECQPYDCTDLMFEKLPVPPLSIVGLLAADEAVRVEKVFKKNEAESLLDSVRVQYDTEFPSLRQCLAYLERDPTRSTGYPELIPDLKNLKMW